MSRARRGRRGKKKVGVEEKKKEEKEKESGQRASERMGKKSLVVTNDFGEKTVESERTKRGRLRSWFEFSISSPLGSQCALYLVAKGG